jgi:hypothetical protein
MSSKTDRKYRMFARLARYGISESDAITLRRIQMTLTAWGAAECGTDGGAIERDEKTGKPYLTWGTGEPDGKRGRRRIADREGGALKRLAKIMAAYPHLVPYYQTDPRGCSLYIVQRTDIREGEKLESIYTRGVAVCD